MKLSIEAVKFVKEYYPRDAFDNETVNMYRLNLDKLPPIIVNRDYVLIDGYHRLLAHRLENKTEIDVEIWDVEEKDILLQAAKINSQHGRQLSRDEKRKLAVIFYKNNNLTLKQISELLAVSQSTLSESWLKNAIKELKEEQKKRIIELYLQCLTYEQISEKIGVSIGKVSEIFTKLKTELSEKPIIPESLQLFNVWNFANRDIKYGLAMEGAIPGQIVENILYYFTEPFDLVVDPMAGSGTTIDVCKAMYRRYLAYDLEPKREDIKKNDIRTGLPEEAKNCDLIFLDPPYFNMVFENYATIEDFYNFMEQVAKVSYQTVKKGGIVALLIQDMTEKANHCLSGESYRIFRNQKFECVAHISCPLSTQQFNEQQIEKAKREKHLLGRNRDLYIFKK